MNYSVEYYKEKDTDPMVFLQRFRCTTEPIGGGTEQDEEGELVSWDAAVEAIEIAKKQLGWHPASELPPEEGEYITIMSNSLGEHGEICFNDFSNGEWRYTGYDWEPREVLLWCYPPKEDKK